MIDQLFNRSLWKIGIYFIILFTYSPQLVGQQKNNYTLLWEITGNGLEKPSYLFGTIHVRDAKAFHFSDSVWKALQASNTLVLEAHPDSLMAAMHQMVWQNKEGLAGNLNTAQKDKVMQQFEKKNGYLPDSSMLSDPLFIVNAMRMEDEKPDDMPTFMDAYFYGLARTWKKQILGIEHSSTQIDMMLGADAIDGLFNQDELAEKEGKELLIEAYQTGNLEYIWQQLQNVGADDEQLVSRNQTMCQNLIPLLSQNTLFIAVGAAHLPGREGIISLLQQRGYSLRPVEATFTDDIRSYSIDYALMDWLQYTDSTNHFSLDFPVAAHYRKEKNGTSSMIAPDMSNNIIYTANAYFVGPLYITEEQYLETAMQQYLKNEKVDLLSKQLSVDNGVNTLSATVKKHNTYSKIQLRFLYHTFYSLAAEGSKEVPPNEYTDRFFNSFKVWKPTDTQALPWIAYKNDTGAFEVQLPTSPQEMIQKVPIPDHHELEAIQIYMYYAVDKEKMVNYIARYSDLPRGMYMENRPAVLAESIQAIANLGEMIDEPRAISHQGLAGLAASVKLNGSRMEIRCFTRGNRIYLLARQNLNGTEAIEQDDDFFDSFRFMDYAEPTMSPFTFGGITVDVPGTPKIIREDEKEDPGSFITDNNLYAVVDSNSGDAYTLEHARLSRYFRLDVDSLFSRFLRASTSASDSLHLSTKVDMGPIECREYLLVDSISAMEKRIRMWIANGQYFILRAVIGKNRAFSPTINRFFSYVKRENLLADIDITTSKATLILDDLRHADTLVSKESYYALANYYSFDENELPLLHQALKYTYNDDSTYSGTRVKLIRTISSLPDNNSSKALQELYDNPKNTDAIRSAVLSEITSLDKSAYEWYLKNLVKEPDLPREQLYRVMQPLHDSLDFAADHIDQLLLLLDVKTYRPHILSLIYKLFNEEMLTQEALPKVQKSLASHASSDLDDFIADCEQGDQKNYNAIYYYLNVLPASGLTSLTNEFTNKVFTVDSVPYLHTLALAKRINAYLPVDEKLIATQLDSMTSRLPIIKALADVDELQRVPPTYLEREELAKLIVYDFLTDEYDAPEEISLLGSISVNGKSYYACAFTYMEGDTETTYFGLVGPFGSQSTELELNKYICYTNYDEVEEDWEAQSKSLLSTVEN